MRNWDFLMKKCVVLLENINIELKYKNDGNIIFYISNSFGNCGI